MQKLEAQGFTFSNWVDAAPDADGETPQEQAAVMFKRNTRLYSTEYREVQPDGSVFPNS